MKKAKTHSNHVLIYGIEDSYRAMTVRYGGYIVAKMLMLCGLPSKGERMERYHDESLTDFQRWQFALVEIHKQKKRIQELEEANKNLFEVAEKRAKAMEELDECIQELEGQLEKEKINYMAIDDDRMFQVGVRDETIAQLRKQLELLNEECGGLNADNERLRNALEFYADKENYMEDAIGGVASKLKYTPVLHDNGKRATEALSCTQNE